MLSGRAAFAARAGEARPVYEPGCRACWHFAANGQLRRTRAAKPHIGNSAPYRSRNRNRFPCYLAAGNEFGALQFAASQAKRLIFHEFFGASLSLPPPVSEKMRRLSFQAKQLAWVESEGLCTHFATLRIRGKPLGKFLREWRLRESLTQKAVALRRGISVKTLSRIGDWPKDTREDRVTCGDQSATAKAQVPPLPQGQRTISRCLYSCP